MDSQTLMLIILVIVLIFVYKVMSSVGMKKMANQESEIEEYMAQELELKIFYDKGKRQAIANLDTFEKDGKISVVMFLTEPPQNEVQRMTEGKWVKGGPALVRVRKGTNEVVSWTYIK